MKENNKDKRDLEFLYEMGSLRFIPRMWRQFLNKDFANLSEHIFRVIWISIMLAEKEGADANKVMKMALVHDISESRVGDVHYLSKMYVKRDEDKANEDILEGTSLNDEFLELVQEYEERKSLEAKIVKDADNLDVEMELIEQMSQAGKLKETFEPMRENVKNNCLFTDSAKKMFDDIQKSNPHDWHWNGDNRMTKGDWQIKKKEE